MAAAEEAAQVRALTTRPEVVALRVDRVRAQVDILLWAGIVLGLLFTTVNVQQFAAAGAAVFTPAWWVAWLLDPMVSLVLLTVLRAEQVTARYQVPLGTWPRRTKWCTFAATYLMNTWSSWGLDGGALSASGLVLHSVPPLLVVLSAETGPVLRDRLTEAAQRALINVQSGHGADRDVPTAELSSHVTTMFVNGSSPANGSALEGSSGTVHEPPIQDHETGAREPVHEQVREQRPGQTMNGSAASTGRRQGRRRTRPRTPAPRRLLADYLDQARGALAEISAAGEGPDPTPAWCRRVTGCSAGTSVKLAAALRASAETSARPRTNGGGSGKGDEDGPGGQLNGADGPVRPGTPGGGPRR